MLENLAIRLLNQSEGVQMAFGVLVLISGFLVGLYFRRGATLSMRRVPYFIGTSAVFALLSTLPLAWLLMFTASKNGILWLLVASVSGGIFSCGIAYSVLGHARSVNAYGIGSGAWMGMVPLLNLVLLFKRPMDWGKSTSDVFVPNFLGVILGVFLLFVGSGIGVLAETQLVKRAKSDPELQQASIEMTIRGQGLEAALQVMAAEVAKQRVDETTTLLHIEAHGSTMRYVYEVSVDATSLPASLRNGLIKHNCSYNAIRPVILAGATLEHVYLRRDHSEIGMVTVTRESCDY